jgi:pSer/pThr/pTyr-binding forkhead associated (FHA) protein
VSARLEVIEEERSFELVEEQIIIVGRESDCTLVLANPAVSRHHLRLVSRGIEWLVEDLGSRHGTLLNGAPLRENHAVSLRDRDRLEVAGTQVVFYGDKPDLATEERTAFLAQQVVADMLGSMSGQESSPYLRFLDGPEEGDRVLLDGKKPYLILGRSPDCDVMLDEANVSRRHARVTVDFSGIWVEDLGSKNGIIVAAKVVRDKVRLHDRTEVQVGGVRMMFCDPASAYLGDLERSGEQFEATDGEESPAAEDESAEASVAVPLSTGQDSGLQLPVDDEPEEGESKTSLALDDGGNWSKSMPALSQASEPTRDDEEEVSELTTQPHDKLLITIFVGATILLASVVGLLLF